MDQLKYRCHKCLNEIEDPEHACPNCGWLQDSPVPEGALVPETVLDGRYFVGRAAYQNAECFVYAAFDQEEDARIWLREFFPHKIARRGHTSQEVLVAAENRRAFADWREDFRELYTKTKEAATLRAVTPVLDVFEWGGTVYAVEKYIASMSLREHLTHSGGSIAAPAAKRLFMPLFTALSRFHAKGFIHGGICLDSLYLDAKQNLWLRSGGTRQLSLHEKGGPSDVFYPPEQHDPNAFWNPATDVYALGAVLYRTLTGTSPTDADARRSGDRLLAPIELDPDIPQNVSDAVMQAMELDKERRPQSIDAFSAILLESESTNTAVFNPPVIEEEEVRKPTVRTILKLSRISPSVAYFLLGSALVFLLIGFSLSYFFNDVFSTLYLNEEEASQTMQEESQGIQDEDQAVLPTFVGTYIVTVQQDDEYLRQFVFKTEEVFDETYPAGVVCRQEPRAGRPVPENGQVTLYVSRGSAYVEMPDLVGCTLNFAANELNKLNIKYNLEDVVDLSYPAGIVIGVDQEPGTRMRRFSGEVTLQVTR